MANDLNIEGIIPDGPEPLETLLTVSEDINERSNSTRTRLRTIKKIGVGLLFLLVCLTPSIGIGTEWGLLTRPICDHLDRNYNEPDLSKSICDNPTQFHLGQNLYLTVCHVDNEYVLDVRRFINQTATIIGVQMNLSQWKKLQHVADKLRTTLA